MSDPQGNKNEPTNNQPPQQEESGQAKFSVALLEMGPYVADRTERTNPVPLALPEARRQNPNLNRDIPLSNFMTECGMCRAQNQAIALCFDCKRYVCKNCERHHVRSRHSLNHDLFYFKPHLWESRNGSSVWDEQITGNLSEVPGAEDLVMAPRLPLHARAVGAERRSMSERNRNSTEFFHGLNLSSSTDSSGQLVVPSGPSSVSSNQSNAISLFNPYERALQYMPTCSKHFQHLLMQCTKCNLPVCPSCIHSDHANHAISPMPHTVQLVQHVTNQIKLMQKNMRESMEKMHYVERQIEYRACDVVVAIKAAARKMISLIEKQQANLVAQVNQVRKVKTSIVHHQMDNLHNKFDTLYQASTRLTRAEADNNVNDLTKILETASQSLAELRYMQNNGAFVPLENATIEFTNPSSLILEFLANFGSIQVQTPALHQSFVLSNSASAFTNHEVNLSPDPVPMSLSRPIQGYPNLVFIKDYRRMPIHTIGHTGSEQMEFRRPWGIAFNRFGQLIVADRSNSRVQIFQKNGDDYLTFGSHGNGIGQFDRPSSVAVNLNDDIVVCDKDNHRIQVFDRHGNFLHMFGERGSRVGQFMYPWDVACNKLGQIAVSDTRNNRVQLFHWDGTFITLFGAENTTSRIRKLFDSPRGVTFDPFGNILMTDFNMHHVVFINTHDGSIQTIGREGSLRGYFNRPQGIICDDRGWFAVVDAKNSRVQVFNERRQCKWIIGGRVPRPRDSTGEPAPFILDRPSSVCMDPDGHLCVVDFGHDRIVIW